MKRMFMVVMVMVLVVLACSSVASAAQSAQSFRTGYGDLILMQFSINDAGQTVAVVKVAPACFRTKGVVEGVKFSVNGIEMSSMEDNMFVYEFTCTPKTQISVDITTGGVTRPFSVTFR